MERDCGAAKLNPEVVVTGNGPEAKLGLPMGVVDIGVNDRAYLCRVSLPGLVKKKNDLSFEIKRDGTIIVRGVERVHELFNEFIKLNIVQELIPPGPFTISFSLPGPVDTRVASPQLRADGILEIIVFKMGCCPTRAD